MSEALQPPTSSPEDLRTQERMRRASVADAIDLLGRAVVTVPVTATAFEVATILGRHGQRTLPVVDADRKLVGVIRAWNIVDSLFFHVTPTEFLSELFKSGGVERFRSLLGAANAGEMMSEPVAVHADEPLTRAFHLIHSNDLEGVPVIDDERRVVGLLDRIGILRLWVRLRGREIAGQANTAMPNADV